MAEVPLEERNSKVLRLQLLTESRGDTYNYTFPLRKLFRQTDLLWKPELASLYSIRVSLSCMTVRS